MTFFDIIDQGLIALWSRQAAFTSEALTALMICGYAACIILPYLLGSVNFAIVLSKLFYHDDIRKFGSGNAGATNMMRTYGLKAAALTYLGDILKGAASVCLGYLVFGRHGAFIAGIACVIGHVFPVFYKFRGGKGVATASVVILMTSPLVFLCVIVLFLLLVWATKYISLSSVIAAMVYPILLSKLEPGSPYIPFAFAITIIIVFMHRQNIKRLWEGTESKISFKKKKKNDD